ncbi:MAG: GGDEF domain-containing protein [Treponemataceae bacterium]|nr:GGDEF domain-containing protein [Treponemataceae bacterium]
MNDIPVWKLFLQTYTTEIIVFSLIFLGLVVFQFLIIVKHRNASFLTFKNLFEMKDGLTGLSNSIEFRRLVRNHLVTVSDLSKDALLLMDVDDMKLFNDENGTEEGDRKLKELSDYIKNKFRSSDIICRYESDTFAVYLKNVLSEKMLYKKCSEFIEKNYYLPVSIGATMINNREIFSAAFQRVAEALAISKKEGKGRFTVL